MAIISACTAEIGGLSRQNIKMGARMSDERTHGSIVHLYRRRMAKLQDAMR